MLRFCVALFIVLCGIVACDDPAPVTTGGSGAAFRVAMILPGSDTDHGWNQIAREGLDRIKAELGADVKLVTNVKTSEFAGQIGYFAGEGYDVVICHGGEFEKDVATAAARYTKTKFIVGGAPREVAGAASVEFVAGDASKLVGLVAAQVTKSKTVAFVGAMPIPTLVACYDGMKSGAESTGGGVKVLPALWTDSWDSPTRAKEKAESAINAGADVIFQNVDAAAVGVFEAAKAANKPDRPVFAFGCNSNQNGLAPEVILGSVVLDVQRTYLELTKQAKEGKLTAGHKRLGLAGGYVDLILNEKHPAISAAVRGKVDEMSKKIVGQ